MKPGDLVRYPRYEPDMVIGLVLSGPRRTKSPFGIEDDDFYVDVLFSKWATVMGVSVDNLEIYNEGR